MPTFDDIRRMFDKEHRQTWEDAFSGLSVFENNRVRVVATTPEKVLDSPSHRELPEVSAQVLFSDTTDTPRISIDFYETVQGVVVGVTFYFGERPVAGGFTKIETIESWIATQAAATSEYLGTRIERASKEFGDLRSRPL